MGKRLAFVMLGLVITSRASAAADAPIAASPPSPAASATPPANGSTTPATQQDSAAASCDADPCADRCACRTRCCASSCACRTPSLSLAVSGIRPSITRIVSPGSTTTDLGVALAGAVDTYALDGTTHGSLQFVLGGGQAGFEGMLAGAIDVGYRIDITEKHGPFGRAAFDGRIQGNDRLYLRRAEARESARPDSCTRGCPKRD